MSNENETDQESGQAADSPETMSDQKFMALADKFIDLANQENQTVKATALHVIFLYAASRYNAHVAKNVLNIEEHEPFVNEMVKVYQEMLRNHLADPNL